MIKGILLAVLLATTVAQIFPGCGGSGTPPTVIGWVQRKLYLPTRMPEPYIIVINYIEYGVEYGFWIQVDVGDLVKYENGVWSIVKKGG